VPGHPQGPPSGDEWWFRQAEDLLGSLTGVLSAKIIPRPAGGIEGVHVLTTEEVSPKQTVRNVESALQARYNLSVDHRRISVAQTSAQSVQQDSAEALPQDAPGLRAVPTGPAGSSDPTAAAGRTDNGRWLRPAEPPPSITPAHRAAEGRILFVGHSIESLRSQQVTMRVSLDWRGESFVGEAAGTDLARSQLEGFANATLRAIESILSRASARTALGGATLSLDGVKLIEAFERQFVLVTVSALFDSRVSVLTGAGAVRDSQDRAVILATLQATDRRVRAYLEGVERLPVARPSGLGTGHGDPFEVWG
jgi:hypothetical protein